MKRLDTNLKVAKTKKNQDNQVIQKSEKGSVRGDNSGIYAQIQSPNETNFQTPVNVRANVSIAGAKVVMRKKKIDRFQIIHREPSQVSVEKKSSNKSSSHYLNIEDV